MTAFKKRTNYDLNEFFAEGRVMEEPIFDTYKMPDGSITPRLRFSVITNSNQFTNKVSCHYDCVAYGRRAERMNAIVRKGYGIYFKGEMKEIVTKSVDKTLRKSTITHTPVFQIERLHILSVPNTADNTATSTDVFVGLEEEV